MDVYEACIVLLCENTLQQCQYDDWLKSYWNSNSEVGVICKTHDFDPDESVSIRLTGSSVPNAGRIEVLYSGIWGAISRSNWDINDATVACRQLGYQAGAEAALANSVYGPVSGPVWLTNLHCSGSETNLMSCSHDVIGNKSELQRRWNIASVICRDGSLTNGLDMRLRGSSVPHAGRVELRLKGVWGTLYYDPNYDYDNVTRVICRQFNFTDGILAFDYSVFGPGTGPLWFQARDLQCIGNESNLLNCNHPEAQLTIVSHHYYDLSVVCKPDVPQTNDFQVRLTGSSSLPFAGTIEVLYYGVWGGVLGIGSVDINVGHVVCRQLGYSGADEIFQHAAFGKMKGPFWIWRIQCNGHEKEISHCVVTTWDNITNLWRQSYYQQPQYAAGVLCNEANYSASKKLKVRLAGAPISNAGRVEVFYAGVWGTVDAYLWDITGAHVVCRQLGYPGAVSYGRSNQFGIGSGPVWFSNVRCLGNESNIGECPKNVYGYSNSHIATAQCKLPYLSGKK
ncbi:hypothetical protein OS493_018801 [Desmophyllum pertusum]|uniref:SRCR domain-containing protein n=1 Tax=Desmophyllum pertusum TaxID=174260 RepID=A0A9W9ZC73_9CNID|nr:hypothetical protein OS493_018801 [Desmophyllum pertusum]